MEIIKNYDINGDNADEIRFISSASGKVWKYIPAYLLMLGVCIFLIYGENPQITSVHRLFGWAGVTVFGAGLVVAIKRLFGSSQPAISMTPAGFHATHVTARPIPWSEIDHIRTWTFRGTEILILDVTDRAESAAGVRFLSRLIHSLSRLMGIDGLSISMIGLPISAGQLCQLANAYRSRIAATVE